MVNRPGFSPSWLLFNIVSRKWVVGDHQCASESIDAVSYGDVQGLTEDTIQLGRVGDDLGVAARYVKDDGVIGARYRATHLDI